MKRLNRSKSLGLALCCVSCCQAFTSHSGPLVRRHRPLSVSVSFPEDGSSSTNINASENNNPSTLGSKKKMSRAAIWHQERRKAMIQKYPEILALEKKSSQHVGLPLLVLGNFTLFLCSIWAGSLSIPGVVLLSLFPGAILSLWQLQILHDAIHGTLLDPSLKKTLQSKVLFWGSLPCVFGYYLYLQYGHLTHHKNVGDASLLQVFDSTQVDMEDGDVLFTGHRMQLQGETGPQISIGGKRRPFSIARSGFHFWRLNQPIWNASVFCLSFLFERYMLCWNDVVVAISGRNFFFPNKPAAFHQDCAKYARVAVTLRLALWAIAGWKALLFLYLSETLWSLPPHPACAMFITNHGSKGDGEKCEPSSSTYAGAWYSAMTLGTNYHREHHDFPSIPFHLLGKLHQIAPEFYTADASAKDDVFRIMKDTFAEPDFYACTNANRLQDTVQEEWRREKIEGES